MDEPPAQWQGSFVVHAFEMDRRGQLSLLALCDWLQEAAGRHAAALGWSIHELLGRGQTWVLSRLSLRVLRHPVFDATVSVATWPSGVQRLHSLRDFRVRLADGGEVAVATTGWLLLDAARRRPLRPPAAIAEAAERAPGRVLDDGFDRLPELDADDGRGVPLTVPWSAIDVNGHANNVRVVEWLLAASPPELAARAAPVGLEVEFRSEARCGERLRSLAEERGDGTLVHRLERVTDGHEVARGRTVWRPPGDAGPVGDR